MAEQPQVSPEEFALLKTGLSESIARKVGEYAVASKAAAKARKKLEKSFVVEKEGERYAVKVDGEWYRISKAGEIREGPPRDYRLTTLATLKTCPLTPELKQELLLGLYGEVNNNWRALMDVRFRLLGFVPAVSIVVWAQLLSGELLKTSQGVWAALGIALIGLLLTRGIRNYDKRNDGLYDDLISRGRKIEEELGVDTGVFLGRLRSTSFWIEHSAALNIIYRAVLFGWIGMAGWFLKIILCTKPLSLLDLW